VEKNDRTYFHTLNALFSRRFLDGEKSGQSVSRRIAA